MFFPVIILVLALQCGIGSLVEGEPLVVGYYRESCPFAEEIVQRVVARAVLRDPRMAASLLRLHFHDCFVMGCDGSILLDSVGGILSEKLAGPNINSVRGFEVIDEIKYYLEEACPHTVSCADILAIAARDSVVLRGGPSWEVWLGRRDSLTASFTGANQFIPLPNSSLVGLIANFGQQGLDIGDLVALSGSHTFGRARCLSFRQRVYQDYNPEEYHDRYQKQTTFRRVLSSICPETGGDQRLAPLDYVTKNLFDNEYFINILQERGLLHSDNVLVNEDHEGEILSRVWYYASDRQAFFSSFVESIVKMGNINVLTGVQGEIRRNCRLVNI
ncbi:peroxidase 20 [Punica granatum]|uniref:Peroxidase n=1 Tax=Punica granatum TaxID=22663 RepID=A0A6P8D563_PUNGR|nr:peroxidase 20 [Punica granatum]